MLRTLLKVPSQKIIAKFDFYVQILFFGKKIKKTKFERRNQIHFTFIFNFCHFKKFIFNSSHVKKF